MDGGYALFDILIFAAIAAFLIFRLRSVLGRRTGNERPPRPLGRGRGEERAENENVISLPEREAHGDAVAETPLDAGLTQIQIADNNFDPEEFLVGARVAFEMVVSSFAKGDKEALRPLLSDEVFDNFAHAIDNRERRGETLETTLVGIKDATIIEARLESRIAFVTVRFVTDQINVTTSVHGEVIEGDADHVARVTDIWTFARNTRSRDPNWALVETRTEN